MNNTHKVAQEVLEQIESIFKKEMWPLILTIPMSCRFELTVDIRDLFIKSSWRGNYTNALSRADESISLETFIPYEDDK